MIKTIIIITLILLALWLTGCWGYKAKQDKEKLMPSLNMNGV